MKITAKVFLILTIVASIIGSLILFATSCTTCATSFTSLGGGLSTDGLSQAIGCSATGVSILLAIICLVPAIVCWIAYVKLCNASFKSDIIVISIITLIFGNVIAGILMLLIPESEL